MRISAKPPTRRHLQILGKLSPLVAHDVNNMLSGILGYGQIMIEDSTVGALRPHVEEILKSSRRVASMIQILQTFNPQSFCQPEILDLNIFLQELDRYLRLMLGPSIALSVTESPDLCPILADATCVRQAMLLLAAIIEDAFSPGATLSIAVRNVYPGADAEDRTVEVALHAVAVQKDARNGATEPGITPGSNTPGEDSTVAPSVPSPLYADISAILERCGGRVSYTRLDEDCRRKPRKLRIDMIFPGAPSRPLR